MELSRRKFLKVSVAASGAAATLASTGNLAFATECLPTVWDLTAGKTTVVGTVTVWNDGTNIYVKYDLTAAGAAFGMLQMGIFKNIADIPNGGASRPPPGHLPHHFDATGLTTYTFTIPFTELLIADIKQWCGLPLYIVTHAEVDMDGDGEGDHETGFGGDHPGDGNAWWFYGVYAVCCPDTDPPPDPTHCETAFGRLGKNETYANGRDYVFTTDPKSNPEHLPSLSLSNNRWGWAIKLSAGGTYNGVIFAGAGRNDIRKGDKVGTIRIVWNCDPATGASSVMVRYSLSADYPTAQLGEVHIYASPDAPTTTAPGQYGFIEYFDADSDTRLFDTTITLPDDVNCDGGLWIIMHAVVCW